MELDLPDHDPPSTGRRRWLKPLPGAAAAVVATTLITRRARAALDQATGEARSEMEESPS